MDLAAKDICFIAVIAAMLLGLAVFIWDTLRKRDRCIFCGKRGEDMLHLPRFNYRHTYGGTDRWLSSPPPGYVDFHMDCLRDVVANPQKWGHKKADWSFELTEIMREMKRVGWKTDAELAREERQKRVRLAAEELDVAAGEVASGEPVHKYDLGVDDWLVF